MEKKVRFKGTCSSGATFTINDDGTVKDIVFSGGCNGNLKTIAKLCEGMNIEQIISKLKNTTCGFKNTSCSDQFAKSLEEIQTTETL
ncbi:TIGR03905 family TSCPD domain-containing protein [Eubacteriales bacterium OttesenSCG-928-G02]|nr:TIGR03905 family TSCPD domain-containing protein [Eubacteriales bacterium OttesenSCG-928-G02]